MAYGARGYGRGDYAAGRGDYGAGGYRGGLGSFLKKVAKGVTGAVRGFATGGPLGAITGAVGGIAGGGRAAALPGGMPTLAQMGGRVTGPSIQVGGGRGFAATGPSMQLQLGGGGPGRKFRRINAGNAKAARRAIRRIKAARSLLQSIESQLPRRAARVKRGRSCG